MFCDEAAASKRTVNDETIRRFTRLPPFDSSCSSSCLLLVPSAAIAVSLFDPSNGEITSGISSDMIRAKYYEKRFLSSMHAYVDVRRVREPIGISLAIVEYWQRPLLLNASIDPRRTPIGPHLLIDRSFTFTTTSNHSFNHLKMSSNYMLFRCVFSIINLCFFVSSRRQLARHVDGALFSLGAGPCRSRLQLAAAHQVDRLWLADGQSMVYCPGHTDHLR